VKAYNLAYDKARRDSDPSYKLARTLRNRLYDTLKNGWKGSSALRLLDMNLDEFQIYVHGQFRPGMTWENHGPVWHLDHVRPCASFDLSDPEQQKICFRWDNYQPLFARENLEKGDKWLPQIS
jgi:hypothetical protein